MLKFLVFSSIYESLSSNTGEYRDTTNGIICSLSVPDVICSIEEAVLICDVNTTEISGIAVLQALNCSISLDNIEGTVNSCSL